MRMKDIVITESGMNFGPYSLQECFGIEESRCYQAIRNGVKTVDFVLLRRGKKDSRSIWFVEAKSSSPRLEKNREKADEFFANIRDKMRDALMLTWAMRLGRHPDFSDGLPSDFMNSEMSGTAVRFVLVIRSVPEWELPNLQDGLRLALHATLKTWRNADVLVLDEKCARRKGLINEKSGGDA